MAIPSGSFALANRPTGAPAPNSGVLPASIVQTRAALASLAASPERTITPDPWTNLTGGSNSSPSAREGEALVYDPDGPYVLLFGGAGGHGAMHDTWTFANGQWTNISSTLHVQPSNRYKPAAVWDAADGYVLLFGGHASPYLNDTWKFQNGTWTQLFPTLSPPAREDALIADDPADGYVVMFGGENNANNLMNDTWTYLAGVWTNLTSRIAHAPPTREAGGMTWDSANNYAVLFGGSNDPRGDLRDTWTYRAGVWTNRTNLSMSTPVKRETPMLAYDPIDGFALLFGGLKYPNSLNDTWALSNGTWTQLNVGPTPLARWGGEVTWDANGGRGFVLLFGGVAAPTVAYYGDTWSFKVPLSANLSSGPTHFDLGGRTNLTISAVGGYPSYNYTWLGLPPGCTGANTSALACQPADIGTYNVTAVVEDSAGTIVSTNTVPLVVTDVPAVTGTVSPLRGDAPLQVEFGSAVTAGTAPFTYAWAFGDGGTSNLSSGNYTFTEAGTYGPTLTIEDAAGVFAAAPTMPTITVGNALGVTIVANITQGTVPLEVGFSAVVLGGLAPYSYLWELGPAGVESSLAAPSYSYETPGTYEVSVSVTDSVGGNVVAFDNVTAQSLTPLTVTASASPPSGTAPLGVTLTAVPSGGSGSDTFAWSFGDGTSDGTGISTPHTYASAGTYSATVTVTDGTGATAQATVIVQVSAASVLTIPFNASFVYTVGASYCASGSPVAAVDLNATASGGTAPYAYAWVVGTTTTTGSIVAVTVPAGARASMVLTASDAAGHLAKVYQNATVGPLSCTSPSGGPSSSLSILLLLAIAVVGIIVAVEVVLLLRRAKP
jgi:PKD repeat protein